MININISNASTVIFSDGFESDFSEWTDHHDRWTTSGTSVSNGVKSGERRGEVKGNTEPEDDILLKNISTTGHETIVLSFWYRIKESLEDVDHVYVEWTEDGSSWNLLNDFTAVAKSDAWESVSYNLPTGADDKSNFGFRFRAVLGAASSDIFYLDDVSLSGNDGISALPPTPSPTLLPTLSPTPESTLIPTPSPTPSAIPTAIPRTPTPMPMISKTPTPLPSPSVVPQSSQGSGRQAESLTPLVAAVQEQENNKVLSGDNDENLFVLESPEATGALEEEENKITENSSGLFATIYKFAGSGSFWLIGLMVFAVIFSLFKFKRD